MERKLTSRKAYQRRVANSVKSS